MIGNLLALLFLSRDWAHRQHLSTRSEPKHRALNDFYDTLTEQLDTLTELYQGRNEVVVDIPQMPLPGSTVDLKEAVKNFLALFETFLYKAIPKEDTPLQNVCDEIVSTYLRLIYKLSFTEI